MDLKFDLHTAKYDAYRKLVRFVAMDGAVRVKCAVTLEALARAEGKSVADKTSPALFRTRRAQHWRGRCLAGS